MNGTETEEKEMVIACLTAISCSCRRHTDKFMKEGVGGIQELNRDQRMVAYFHIAVTQLANDKIKKLYTGKVWLNIKYKVDGSPIVPPPDKPLMAFTSANHLTPGGGVQEGLAINALLRYLQYKSYDISKLFRFIRVPSSYGKKGETRFDLNILAMDDYCRIFAFAVNSGDGDLFGYLRNFFCGYGFGPNHFFKRVFIENIDRVVFQTSQFNKSNL